MEEVEEQGRSGSCRAPARRPERAAAVTVRGGGGCRIKGGEGEPEAAVRARKGGEPAFCLVLLESV